MLPGSPPWLEVDAACNSEAAVPLPLLHQQATLKSGQAGKMPHLSQRQMYSLSLLLSSRPGPNAATCVVLLQT